MEISEYDQSIADFKRVLELEPGNKGAVKLLDHTKRLLKDQNDKERKMYASMFSKTFPDPKHQEVCITVRYSLIHCILISRIELVVNIRTFYSCFQSLISLFIHQINSFF